MSDAQKQIVVKAWLAGLALTMLGALGYAIAIGDDRALLIAVGVGAVYALPSLIFAPLLMPKLAVDASVEPLFALAPEDEPAPRKPVNPTIERILRAVLLIPALAVGAAATIAVAMVLLA